MSRRVRVAFVQQDARIGGAEVNLLSLVRRMDRQRFDPLVFCAETGPLLDALARLRDSGVAVGFSTSGPGQGATILRAMELTRGGGPVFSAVQSTWNLLETSAGQALAAASRRELTVIVKEALANGRLVAEPPAAVLATASATLDLQALLERHGYSEGIIFGHALEGNLHFVFTQDFSTDAEVQRYAQGLDHPRWLLVLPNGDVLVAETNAPAKPDDASGIRGWIMGLVMKRAGAVTPSANRITLLRDTQGKGVADQRFVLLEGLNSPFGMALVGDRFYVANTDSIWEYPYSAGALSIDGPGRQLTELPGGPLNHHWTKSLIASPDGRMLAYKKVCADLIEAGATEFSPALHGHTAELHDYLVHAPGAFKQTVRAIANLKELGALVITNSVIVRANYRHLPELATVLTSLGVDQYQVFDLG